MPPPGLRAGEGRPVSWKLRIDSMNRFRTISSHCARAGSPGVDARRLAAETKTPCSIPILFPSSPTDAADRSAASAPGGRGRTDVSATGAIHTIAGTPATGAIRTLGPNPATAPIVLHPGDSISHGRRIVYIILLGALTALGPFTVDLYLPAFPVLEEDFQTTATMIQLTLTGTMLGFGLGQLIVGPLSDKVGRRIPLLSVTALHVVASVAAATGADAARTRASPACFMGMGAAAGGVVAMAIVRDLFGGRRLVVMLSRLALVSGVAPVAAPLIGSALLIVMPWRGIFVVLAAYGVVMLVCAIFLVPETLPKARRHERGQHDGAAALQERPVRPGVHRRADHRRDDLQRTVLVPVELVVPLPEHVRLRCAAVRPAVRGQLARRRASASRRHPGSRRASDRSG